MPLALVSLVYSGPARCLPFAVASRTALSRHVRRRTVRACARLAAPRPDAARLHGDSRRRSSSRIGARRFLIRDSDSASHSADTDVTLHSLTAEGAIDLRFVAIGQPSPRPSISAFVDPSPSPVPWAAAARPALSDDDKPGGAGMVPPAAADLDAGTAGHRAASARAPSRSAATRWPGAWSRNRWTAPSTSRPRRSCARHFAGGSFLRPAASAWRDDGPIGLFSSRRIVPIITSTALGEDCTTATKNLCRRFSIEAPTLT